MTTVTIEQVQAEHQRLAKLIAELQAPAPKTFIVREAHIELRHGERYAGMVLSEDGLFAQHIVLLPGEAEDINWTDAKAWAAKAGGDLPTRQEQALLYANLKGEFKPAWYWSCQEHETDGSYAWTQYFGYGYQFFNFKSYEGRARAVRRFSA